MSQGNNGPVSFFIFIFFASNMLFNEEEKKNRIPWHHMIVFLANLQCICLACYHQQKYPLLDSHKLGPAALIYVQTFWSIMLSSEPKGKPHDWIPILLTLQKLFNCIMMMTLNCILKRHWRIIKWKSSKVTSHNSKGADNTKNT